MLLSSGAEGGASKKALWITPMRHVRTDVAVSPETRRMRAEAEASRRLDDVRGEWLALGMPAPTIGGIPVSVELARQMGLLREWD